MAYLRLRDYYSIIQDSNLEQIIRSDDTLRLTVEQTAQAEVIGYLTQKYDVAKEFEDLLTYNKTTTYKANQLVQLDGNTWLNSTTYAANDIVSLSGLVYYAKLGSNLNHNPSSDTTNWGLLGTQYALFHIPFPYPKFDLYTRYYIGDIVFWKDKVYKCAANSILPDHQAVLQFGTYNNVSFMNSFPDGGVAGLKQWGVGVSYSLSDLPIIYSYAAWSGVTAYVTGDRITYDSITWQALKNSTNIAPDSDITAWQPVSWVSGDNRNSLIVQKTIDIAIYHLNAAIAPRNVPELRTKRYDDAISFLKDCANGNVTLNSPLLQPNQGQRIRYGGNIKNQNSY